MFRPCQQDDGRWKSTTISFPVCILIVLMLATQGCGLFGGGDNESTVNAVKGLVATNKEVSPKAVSASVKEEEPVLTLEILKERMEEKLRAYVFNPEGRVDPFMPIEAILSSQFETTSAEEEIPLPPLQKMELSQIKLVAIVEAGEMTRALVEDSTGTGYIVELGTKMGTKNGEVSGILPDRVEVTENYKNYLGDVKSRVQELKLRPKEGENK